ncbi:MAG: MFS transporter [candidate division KSB1 bacterium]|nr:MFS transporter [candidate division KSB1 bacterium]MDZ7401249.1 MFS transporter [candidate division KSB1 bacterium]
MSNPEKLMNKNFLLLWQGQAVSNLGTQIFSIGMILWIVEATGSTTLMGVIAMVASIPALILGPIGGTVADRHSRKHIIVLSDVLSGLVMLALAALVFYAPQRTELIIAGLFIASVLVAIVGSFFFPSISAAIPDLVPKERLVGANTLSRSSMQLSQLIGQAIGGFLYTLLGAPLIFLLNGISYHFSAISESFISIPHRNNRRTGGWRQQLVGFKQELIDGFRYIWHQKGLREVILAATLINFFTVPIIILLPFFVKAHLNLGDNYRQWFGVLLACYSIGSILGYIFAGASKSSGQIRGKLMILFIILTSAAHGLLGLAGHIYLALALAFFGGFFSGYISVNITTILQWTTPSEIRGRVFGVLTTLVGAVTPVAMGLSGIVADLIHRDLPMIFVFCGAIMAVSSMLIALNQNYRAYLSYEPMANELNEQSAISSAAELALGNE